MAKPAIVKLIKNSFSKKTSIMLAVHFRWEKKEKTALQSDHYENSHIYCAIEDFQFWKGYNLLLRTYSKWSRETVLRAWSAQMNLVVHICENEIKRENLSPSITLNHNPKWNISSLCDKSISLFGNNALWCLTWSLSQIYEQNNVGCNFMFCPVTA